VCVMSDVKDPWASVRGHIDSDRVSVQPILERFGELGNNRLATLCGVSTNTVAKWRSGEVTTVPYVVADALACRHGYHISEWWVDA
jgi:hypothetical protein